VFQSGSKYWFKTVFRTQTSGYSPGEVTGFYLKTIEKYPGKTGFAPQDTC
jgi:hypothetical protein